MSFDSLLMAVCCPRGKQYCNAIVTLLVCACTFSPQIFSCYVYVYILSLLNFSCYFDIFLLCIQVVIYSLSINHLVQACRVLRIPTFQDEQSELINEVLKVLYNLVLHIDKNSPDEEEDSHCLRLINILRSLLLASSRCPEKTDALHR